LPTLEIIDDATIARLLDSLGGDSDFLGELVEAYLTSTPGLLAGMRQAIEAGDGGALQRAAHSLKTGSAGFGALALAAQCKELEEMGKAGALEAGAVKLRALESAYAEVGAALQARTRSAV